MGEFLAMGKYGFYVWIAYGVTLVGLLSLFVWSWFGARSREAELEQVRKWSRAERNAPAPTNSPVISPANSNDHEDPEDAPRARSVRAAAAGGQGNE
ncbi:MAG: heme exporter protein CcmD [Geminicoccaceae bacterium]